MTDDDLIEKLATVIHTSRLHPGFPHDFETCPDRSYYEDEARVLLPVVREAQASAIERVSSFTTAADVTFRDLSEVRDWLRTQAAMYRRGDESEPPIDNPSELNPDVVLAALDQMLEPFTLHRRAEASTLRIQIKKLRDHVAEYPRDGNES